MTLGTTSRALARVAAQVFGLPLAALLLGGWLGAVLRPGDDLVSAVAGCVFLGLASVIVAGRGGAMTGRLRLTVRRQGMIS